MSQPTSCPTFFYPLNEHMPRVTVGRFVCAESIGALRLSGLLGVETGWSESIRASLGRSYDPKTGRLITNDAWHQIACWFSCWHMLDLLDRLPQLVPEFSVEQFSRGTLTTLFADSDPFESTTGWGVHAVTPALTILHYLGSLDLLQDYCDIDEIARQFVSLQDAKSGCFRPAPGTEGPFDDADAFQLQSLVGIHLLEATFDNTYVSRINHAALRSHLKTRLKELASNTQPLCDEWLFNLRNVLASLHMLSGGFAIVPAPEAAAIAKSIMHCFGLTAYWTEFVRAQGEASLDDLEGVWTETERSAFWQERKSLLKEFPGRISGNLGRALWSAFTVLALLKRTSAIAILENAADSRQDISDPLAGSAYYLLGAAFLLRAMPVISLNSTYQWWFRAKRTLLVGLVNETAKPIRRMSLSLGAQQEGPKGFLGAATDDPNCMRIVELKWKVRSDRSGPLEPGKTRIVKVNLRTVRRVRDYPLLFLIPSIKCRYGNRSFRLTREGFHNPMTLQMLPSQGTVKEIIDETRRKSRTHEDLTRLLSDEMKTKFGVALSPVESERLYRVFYPNHVAQWLQQFELRDRRLMKKLVDNIQFFSTDQMIDLFTRVLGKPHVKEKAREAIFVGIGKHQAKSGPHLLTYVKYAYKRTFPEKEKEEIRLRFTDPAKLPDSIRKNGVAPASRISSLFFVDDFFGSGQTVSEFLTGFSQNEAEVYKWQKERYFFAISGFKGGQDRIAGGSAIPRENFILAYRLLSDSDKAFSPENSKIFRLDKDRKRAKEVCREIGKEILRKRAREEHLTDKQREDRALGWDDGQALIRFQHNIPNNCLPVIWEYKGKYKGKLWTPLYRRHD
jgi:hypothetical protein